MTAAAASVIALVAAAACCGCSKSAQKDALTAESSNLKPLSVLYGQFQASHQNRAPANEAEFKKFVSSAGQSLLKQFDTDTDKVFVSERDGQPYVVFYGKEIPPSGVIAHEREGVGGERVVAYPFGSVGLVNEGRFNQLVPNAP
jgi:hypothetical protein